MAAISFPNEKVTALQGSWNANVKRHSPVLTFQSFVLLSDDAVISFEESTAMSKPSTPVKIFSWSSCSLSRRRRQFMPCNKLGNPRTGWKCLSCQYLVLCNVIIEGPVAPNVQINLFDSFCLTNVYSHIYSTQGNTLRSQQIALIAGQGKVSLVTSHDGTAPL